MRIEELNKIVEPEYIRLKNEFALYCEKKLFPFLKNKEQLRLKYVKRFTLLILLAAIILPMFSLLIYFLNHYYQKEIDWGILYLFIAVAVYVIRAPYSSYRKQIKNDVMPMLLSFFDGFRYEGGQGLSLREFADSRIFPPFTTVRADDCFRGTFSGVNIRVCEEILEKITYDSKNRRRVSTVFRGIAIELEMNKNFSGQTIILKDAGLFNAFKKFSGLERVRLEDPVFEKIFEVYSSNQIEARYLLTTAFMERMLSLRELYQGKKVQASFYNNKILIAIDTGQDMFEACSFLKTNLNQQRIDTVFEQIWAIFSIIYLLKLNEKLGL